MESKTILAIETSCDETSAAVLRFDETSGVYSVLSHVTLTQIELHIPYGGVYPNLARRDHQQNITHVIAETLQKAGLLKTIPQPLPTKEGGQDIQNSKFEAFPLGKVAKPDRSLSEILSREEILIPILSDFLSKYEKPELDAIAVTVGPGLEPALWVGVNATRALCSTWNMPAIAVNHMEGHIYSVWAIAEEFTAPEITFPALSLLISGGHSEFIKMKSWGEYEYLGGTVDDAIGEAYDKAARMMNLDYPGGPKISKFADEYKKLNETLPESFILPRPMLHSKDCNFSFSGLKTAVRYMIEKIKNEQETLSELDIMRISYSFESAVIDVLVSKTKKALHETNAQTLIVGGGVAANGNIKQALELLCQQEDNKLFFPTRGLSTDNALMIALAGIQKNPVANLSELKAQGNMKF